MQALRRRTAQAIAQTERRQKLQSIKKSAAGHRERMSKEKQRNAIERKNRLLVKQEVWEKWNLGELQSSKGWFEKQKEDMPKEFAPSRWEMKQKRRMQMLQERLRTTGEKLLLEKEERRRSPEYNVARGDRVVIRATEGPCAKYRGQIGTVIAVRRQQRVCVVEGMTIRQARAPKAAPLYTLFSEPSHDPEHLVLLPIPFSHMRIVKTIINGAGEKEDVILGRLTPQDLIQMGRKLSAEQFEKENDPSPGRIAAKAAKAKAAESAAVRVAAPTEPESEDQKLAREQSSSDQTLAKPKKEPGRLTKLFNRVTGRKPKEDELSEEEKQALEESDPTTPSDTPRLDLDTPTWTPTLLRAPLPGSVIDELRGKYSQFRTRHDPAFVKRMQQIDSARENHKRWVKSGGGLLDTPRKESVLRSQARKRDERIRRGGLDERMLEGIGRLMWERGMRLSPRLEIEAARKATKAQARGAVPKGPVVSAVAVQGADGAWKRELAEAEAR